MAEKSEEKTLPLRLLISVFLVSSTMTLIITIGQLYWEYLQDIGGLDTRIEQVETSYLSSVAQSLWDFNTDQVKIGVDGILRLDDIEYVDVRRKGEVVYAVGKKPEGITISRTFAVKYKQGGEVFTIGKLSLIATQNRIIARLRDKMLLVFVSNAAKAYVVSLFIFLIVRLLVVRHLELIKERFLARDAGLQTATVPFDRRWEIMRGRRDIFDSLMDAVVEKNQLIQDEFTRRRSAEKKLRSINRDLEKTIGERVQELARREAMLQNSGKLAALGEMAGGVAHEINNPLAIIMGKMELIESMIASGDVKSERITPYVQSVLGSVDRIVRIVRGLRFFARDGSSDEMEDTPVSEIIEETLGFCRERFCSHGVDLHVGLPPDNPSVRCRSVQISQVLLNLLNNSFDAVKGLEEKWIRITVRRKGEQISILVADSGPGIPVEIRDKFMQPFITTKEPGEGTGLGLSIAKGIIDEHRGQLALDEAEYTTFRISLPTAA